MPMFQRLAAYRLADLTRRFPVVVILGPRQAGKTTLARLTFPGPPYLDCEDRAVRSLREALPDLDAYRAWIVDQAPGIERLAENIARGSFEELLEGVPARASRNRGRKAEW